MLFIVDRRVDSSPVRMGLDNDSAESLGLSGPACGLMSPVSFHLQDSWLC